MTSKSAPKNPTEEQRQGMAARVAEMKGISIEAARRQIDRKFPTGKA